MHGLDTTERQSGVQMYILEYIKYGTKNNKTGKLITLTGGKSKSKLQILNSLPELINSLTLFSYFNRKY